MKKTNISALLLAALLLIQLLCAPVSAVTAEPAADAQADAQTASDNSAGDAAAEADSVPEDQLLSSREQFSVAAKAALLIDLNTNRVVYEQDADERVYPASLTKIMTCLIALENGNLSDVVTVSESALADLDEDSSVAGLVVGEQMTLENLLYCMMVVSGNDACNVIAEHVAGSVTDFVRMMNQRAYELGCTNTHFNNPHGLHDESHYTTARDLAIITQAALKSENFRQIVDTYEYKLPDDNMRQNIPKLKTTNMLIYQSMSNSLYYPRAHGIKTGYTRAAGRCLVFGARRDGLEVIGVVLNCGDWFNEARRLMDLGFERYEQFTALGAGETVRVLPVKDGTQETVYICAGGDLTAPVPRGEIPVLEYDMPDELQAGMRMGDEVGEARILLDGRTLASVPLVLTESLTPRDYAFELERVLRCWPLQGEPLSQ